MKKFAKNDLKTWDIVEFRNVGLGLVCMEQEKVILQEGGSEWLDDYSDELTDITDNDEMFDIMRVYRDGFGKTLDFLDYCEAAVIFDRDPSWVRPSEEERALIKAQRQKPNEELAVQRDPEKGVTVLAQGYYGNRTLVSVKKDRVDKEIFGIGYSDSDKSCIYLSKEVAIVYSVSGEKSCLERIAENKKLEREPLCTIPEKNIKLYSTCFLCRLDENGEYVDLQNDDIDFVKEYFAW